MSQIEHLVVSGPGHVTVLNEWAIVCPDGFKTVVITGTKIYVETVDPPRETRESTYTNNGTMINSVFGHESDLASGSTYTNNGTMINSVFGHGASVDSISNEYPTLSSSNGNVSIDNFKDGSIKINGVDVTNVVNFALNPRSGANATQYVFDRPFDLVQISAQDAYLTVQGQAISWHRLNVTAKGQSIVNIVTPNDERRLDLTISIYGPGYLNIMGRAHKVQATVVGTGRIEGVHCTGSLNALVKGSGIINVTRTEQCKYVADVKNDVVFGCKGTGQTGLIMAPVLLE